MKKSATAKHEFLVGWQNYQWAVYGTDEGTRASAVRPLTLLQARRKIKDLKPGKARVIYKLVPVESIDGPHPHEAGG